jgi:biotin synthase
MTAREIADQAHTAERSGAREFSIVTSGTRVAKAQELETIAEAVKLIRAESAVEPCASLGLMRAPELARLKEAGLMHYHHNLETARSHFDRVCTTHTYDEQLDTIRAARDLGFQVCSGGILGMGETPEQRVEFAETIRELGIHCVPVNFLNPRPGTPMADVKAITPGECLAALAVFRLMMPAAHLFVMGGREVNLGDQQHRIFDAGADGTMVGNYLTSAGGTPEQVIGMVEQHGLALRPPGTANAGAWGFTGQPEREIHWNERATATKGAKALPVLR